MGLPFIKMHGIGNDFVVLDARAHRFAVSEAAARAIADRQRGVGFDQLIVLDRPQAGGDVAVAFINADGSESGACGNGSRCVAALLMAETGQDKVVLETKGGRLRASAADGGLVTIDMGQPRLEWTEIPLAERMDTRRIDIQIGPIDNPTYWGPAAVNMGNPHAVFFVDNAAAVNLEKVGPLVEHHLLFPEGANVSFAEVIDPAHVRLRVWERGSGATLACGTAACATLVAGVRLNRLERQAEIALPGGTLSIEWRESDNRVLMTGPAELSFHGELNDRLTGLLTKARAA